MNDLVSTDALDAVLNESGHPHAEQAVQELRRLRQMHMHLVTHLIAVKAQNESAITAIEALVR